MKEAAWAVANLVAGAADNQRQELVEAGGMATLVTLLSTFEKEDTILEFTLDAIETLFEVSSFVRLKNFCSDK